MATDKALSERVVSEGSEGSEGPEAPEAPENARPAAVRELMHLLVKAQKAQRLYDGKNAISEKLETDLFNRLSEFLESDGDINLVVLEFHLKFEDELVYDTHDRNDSLAFLLYRDGIRRLSFHPGLEPEEAPSIPDLSQSGIGARD